MRGYRRQRWGQRGQAVPIVALAFVVLIGATALAVDLSLQTHTRRSYQNVSDAASLAGARELPTSVARANQTSAVLAAFNSIQTNLGLPANWQGSPSNRCNAVGVCETVSNFSFSGSTITVSVNTPPQSTANTALKCASNSPAAVDACLHNVEVVINGSSSSSNPLSGFLGFGTGAEGATAIATHNGPDVPFAFALYAANTITTGNQLTKVQGDVYAGRYIAPQSNGQGAFCADDWTMSDGTASKGHVFLGAKQAGDSGYANDGQYANNTLNNNSWVVGTTGNCSNVTVNGAVAETANMNSTADCPVPSGLPGGTTITYNSTTNVCEITPALPAPTFNPPTHTGTTTNIVTVPSGTAWNDNGRRGSVWPTAPGLYDVQHSSTLCNNCFDLSITATLPETLTGFTFYLEAGAKVGITGGQTLNVIPYNPNSPLVVTDNSNDDGVYAFYAVPSGTPELDVGVSGAQANGTVLNIPSGSIIMTTGTVSIGSNAQLLIRGGQAVVNTWLDQSGNHPNPDITYAGAGVPAVEEVLQLVH